MKNKTTFYLSRKSWLTWMTALLMAASAVSRMVFAFMKGVGGSGYFWGQVVLPAVACLLFAWICLFRGEERFYKTAVPIAMMALYFCFQTRTTLPDLPKSFFLLYAFLYVSLAFFYCQVTDGSIPKPYLLLLSYLVPLGFRAVSYWENLEISFVFRALYNGVPDTLFFAGLVAATLAMRPHADGRYHPTWGDRVDGRRIRTLPPMAQASPYLMVNRNGASNLFEDSIEITNIERYIRQKRKEGMESFGINHVLLAAYVRTVCQYPALNRFVSGQKVYSRGDDLQYCMTAKKNMSTDAPDSCFKLHLSRSDTSKEVYEKFSKAVEGIRNTPLDNDFDNTARVLTMVPGVFLKFVVWLLKTMDYFGLLPRFLLEVSPFHGSVFFTSMGSLGIRSIYHHLYDFGNLPVFCAFSAKRKSYEVQADGTVVQRKYVDIKLTLDERIADGYYYAAFFKAFRRILAHPEILDQPPQEIKEDIE